MRMRRRPGHRSSPGAGDGAGRRAVRAARPCVHFHADRPGENFIRGNPDLAITIGVCRPTSGPAPMLCSLRGLPTSPRFAGSVPRYQPVNVMASVAATASRWRALADAGVKRISWRPRFTGRRDRHEGTRAREVQRVGHLRLC